MYQAVRRSFTRTAQHAVARLLIPVNSSVGFRFFGATRRMNNLDDIHGGDAIAAAPVDEPFRLRSYQAEMVAESMNKNIIVVMDTGSGKTHM